MRIWELQLGSRRVKIRGQVRTEGQLKGDISYELKSRGPN
jgi:hypothetical protein